MLFKLSIGNIRKSLRDYAIYFFTLVIGVSVFYVFNAVGNQAALLYVSDSSAEVVELLTGMLSGVSVFVAFVLGLLIVYASRFLMKRRNREFALYMILGMSKTGISAILLFETLLIGIGSLAVGLLIGIGLSQVMSALVVSLFEADMTAYRFIVSGGAVVKTIICFAVMYLVVIMFNSVSVTRMKLIDLMQSGKKSERIRLRNPLLCAAVFVIAVAALGFAYYQVCWRYDSLSRNMLLLSIVLGAVSTFLIFWSVSGSLLRILMSRKKVYYRGLNAFTFRQISSRINTMVFSMTVICLMLFVTICTLNTAFSLRNTMNENLRRYCPADVEISAEPEEGEDLIAFYGDMGWDVTGDLSDYVVIGCYDDPDVTLGSFVKDNPEVTEKYRYMIYESRMEIFGVGEYNELMRLYGQDGLELGEDEYIFVCNVGMAKDMYGYFLKAGYPMNIFGRELVSKYDTCIEGAVDISSQPLNAGLFVVPDSVLEGRYPRTVHLIGNYDADTREDLGRIEKTFVADFEKFSANGIPDSINTKKDISDASIGIGALVTFLGLYIGLVFLIACGAILALKELSESVDSIGRYEMLRKIGAEERDIHRSMFRQTGLFFLLPLILACIHSVFGMKFAIHFMDVFGTLNMWRSIAITSLIVLLIYGGYFIITYFCGRQIAGDGSR